MAAINIQNKKTKTKTHSKEANLVELTRFPITFLQAPWWSSLALWTEAPKQWTCGGWDFCGLTGT